MEGSAEKQMVGSNLEPKLRGFRLPRFAACVYKTGHSKSPAEDFAGSTRKDALKEVILRNHAGDSE